MLSFVFVFLLKFGLQKFEPNLKNIVRQEEKNQ